MKEQKAHDVGEESEGADDDDQLGMPNLCRAGCQKARLTMSNGQRRTGSAEKTRDGFEEDREAKGDKEDTVDEGTEDLNI
jgi:hypothetical protein